MASFFDLFRRGNVNTGSSQGDIISDLDRIKESDDDQKVYESHIDEDFSNNGLLSGNIETITESVVQHSAEEVSRLISNNEYYTDSLLSSLRTGFNLDETYYENEDMARDSVVGGAMEVIADDAVQRDERSGKFVIVESTDEGLANFLQDFLDNNVCVENRLWTWAFGIVEHGDYKLRRCEYYIGSEEDGTKNVYYEDVLNPYKVTRIEYMGKVLGYRDEDSDDNKTTFEKADKFVHFLSVKNSRREKVKVSYKNRKDEMETVTCYKVFGTSLMDNARYIYRIVNLLDNMLILSRVARSTQYNLVKVEVGNASPAKTQQILSDVRRRLEGATKMKKNSGIKTDPSPIPINSNVYVPVREGKGEIQVDSISNDADLHSIVDIDYFKDKEFATLRVPKMYLGFGECFQYDTEVRLLNGKVYKIGYLAEHPELWNGLSIMTCSPDGKLSPSLIKKVCKTRLNANFVKVVLDNGKEVVVTPDHKMMRRDGTFVEAQNLVSGDSLMPFYNRYDGNGRLRIKENIDPISNPWIHQYRVVARCGFESQGMDGIPKGMHIHHIDKVKCNDDPTNLEALTQEEHYFMHLSDFCDKGHEANRGRHHTEESRRKMSLAGKGKKKPESFRKKISEILKGRPSNNPFKKGDGNVLRDPKVLEKHKKSLREYYDNGGTTWVGKYSKEDFDKTVDKILMSRYGHTHRSELIHYRCPNCGKEFDEMTSYEWKKSWVRGPHFCSVKCGREGARYSKALALCRYIDSLNESINEETYSRYNVTVNSKGISRRRTTVSYQDLLDSDYARSIPGYQNHKVVKVIPYVDVFGNEIIEDAYDLEVESENHTFCLEAGIFVHNSDMSSLANNSLMRMDARYARSVQRVQMILINGITDLCKNYLEYRGRRSDFGNFTIKMRPLNTVDTMDRIESFMTSMQAFDSLNGFLETYKPYIDKAKVLKSTLTMVGLSPTEIASEEFLKILEELENGTYKEENHKTPEPEEGNDVGW